MLRTLLIATTLLTVSGSALAYDRDYGRVVQVEPQFTVSFGTRHHDGFRVLYESGGTHYWTHTDYRPSHVIVLPPQHHRVKHVYHHYDNRGGWDKHRKHWRDDRRDDWRDHHKHHRKHHRDHDRNHDD